MFRGSSPLQAKAKRRQSDAKWRASVATCYDALKYVVPNVKNLTKRKISKALILQESEKHIKELEAAVTQLLEVESKKKGKTVLWKEGSHWSHCTLDKLRMDFSEKQQRIFHMAAHGRRCYNLLQDIKEEVFTMEADPSRLAVLEENHQAASSSKPNTVVIDSRAGGGLAKGMQPTHRISLVLSGLCDASKQRGQTAVFKMKGPCLEAVASSSQEVPSQVPSVPPKPYPTKPVPSLSCNHLPLLTRTDATAVMSNLLTLSSQTRESLSAAQRRHGNICANISKDLPDCQGNSSRATTTIRPSTDSDNFLSPSNNQATYQKKTSQDKFQHETTNSLSKNESYRFKVHVDNINGDFYIVSDSKNSTIHLVKAAPVTAETSYTVHLAKTSCPNGENEQEVPSMKLPLKPPDESEQEDTNCSACLTSKDITETPKDSGDVKQEISTSQISAEIDYNASYGCIQDQSFATIQEDKNSLAAVCAQTYTPVQDNKGFLDTIGEVKTETPDVVTKRNNQDPLMSSILTPKLDDSTPLFMRTENDMVIKRPPRLGTARKKLNFGLTPDKQERSCLGKTNLPVGGFTPVKLPDEFGMVPGGNLVSPWKIVDSPSFGNTIASQDCMDSTPMLDLTDNLVCLETMDTMDLDDEFDNDCDISTLPIAKETNLHSGKTCKRKGPPCSPKTSIRPDPKCRRKLEKFYDEPITTWEEFQVEPDASSLCNVDDSQEVPKLNLCHKIDNAGYLDDISNITSDCTKDFQVYPSKPLKQVETYPNENHVVPDFYEIHKTDDCNFTKQELPGPVSPTHRTPNFRCNRDDLNRLSNDHQLTCQQLKQNTSHPIGNKDSVFFDQCLSTTIPADFVLSSPTTAKATYTQSCLPLKDKITLTTLAGLDERSQRGMNTTFQSYRGTIHENQKYKLQDSLLINESFRVQDCRELLHCDSKDYMQLNLLDMDCHDQNFLNMEHTKLKEVERTKFQDQKNKIRHTILQDHPLSSGFNHSNFANVEDLDNFEDIQGLQSCRDNWEDPKTAQVVGNNLQNFLFSQSRESVILGELSQDLRDVEVQPLIDHTYDNSFTSN